MKILISVIYLMFVWLNLQAIVINELMPSNASAFLDEDGDSEDWIELYNPDTYSVDLSGFGISDKDDDPFKWEFPDIELEAGEYLVVVASEKNRDQVANWETIINWGDEWKYFPGSEEPPSNWKEPGFDDSVWDTGATGIGYGYDQATTIDTVVSCYMRKTFDLSQTNEVITGFFHADYDDGFVAYLNGVEIARSNLGYPGSIPTFDQFAIFSHEADIYEGHRPEEFVIENIDAILLNGDNVLAIQVHTIDVSSDLVMIPFLTLGFENLPVNANGIDHLLEFSIPFLHTNFKLSASENITISDAQGNLLDEILVPELEVDISTGRQPDAADDWYIFAQSTPGSANITTGFQGVAGITEFSLPGGVYYEQQTVELLTSESAEQIRYTLNGAEPNINSLFYTEPILIDSTTVIRARNFGTGLIPGEVVTNTYIIDENLSLPVVSICSDPENFFDEEVGILALGDSAETIFPYLGANFWQDWERPINFELYETDGSSAINNRAGIKVFGGYSRGHPQKSLAVYARNKYGTRDFDYQLFNEKPIDQFEAFILRNSGNDWEYSFFRDALMTQIAASTGLDYQAYQPAVVFLNGVYWGMLNLREKINEHFLADNNDLDQDDIDLLENEGYAIHGSADDYLQMMDFVENNDLSIAANFEYISNLIDIDNFITYQVVQIFYANTDWPGQNLKYWREDSDEGKWRWILFDTDFGFGLAHSPNHNTLEFALEANGPSYPNPPWSTLLFRKLIQNNQFKIKFVNRFADLLNTIFRPDNTIPMVDVFRDRIINEYPRHLQRWKECNDSWHNCLDSWENALAIMRNFAEERTEIAFKFLANSLDLNEVNEINLDVYPPEIGKLKVNSIFAESFPWEGTYFQNIPVTLSALNVPGYRFSGWTGDIESDSTTIVLNRVGSYSLIAWYEETTEFADSIVFNEINYRSAEDFDSADWIEIYNRSNINIDISNWTFSDSDDDHIFMIPENTLLPAGEYLVLCRDSEAFTSFYPAIENYLGDFDFGLSSEGEKVRLFDDTGSIIDSVVYGVVSPWPDEPNGGGYTLSLIDPEFDNDLPENWRTSILHGTPGGENHLLQPIPDTNKLYLAQNYPNPFTTFTTFEYVLPKAGKCKLEIYNIKGQQIKTIADEYKEKGIYSAAWNATDKYNRQIASGIYLISLRFKNELKARKMIYIK